MLLTNYLYHRLEEIYKLNSETKEDHKKNEKFTLDFFIKSPHVRINIFGILIIIMGIVFYYNPTPLYLKISLTMIFIGYCLLFMHSKTPIPKRIGDSQTTRNMDAIKKTKVLTSEKITLIVIVWTLFSFFITNEADIQIFFGLIIIGLLVIKQITDEFTTLHLKKIMIIFIIVLLIAYIIIIAQKILTF
jgi:hypothetical protein